MCGLQAPEQLQAVAAELFGSEDGGGRRRRIEHSAVVAQQTFEIGLAKRLPGIFGDAPVVGHHVIAQLRRNLLAIGTGHHAAAMGNHRQNGPGGLHQRLGAVTPAAQRVVDIMKSGHGDSASHEDSMAAG
ncbi:hypothetical protein D3C76_1580560 [compost metagenome]